MPDRGTPQQHLDRSWHTTATQQLDLPTKVRGRLTTNQDTINSINTMYTVSINTININSINSINSISRGLVTTFVARLDVTSQRDNNTIYELNKIHKIALRGRSTGYVETM